MFSRFCGLMMNTMPKKSHTPTLLTGLRPTGTLHIGNYFGSLKQVVDLERTYKPYVMVADLHALTTADDTSSLAERTVSTAAMYVAFGLNPKRSTLFVQSHIPEHAEVSTMLSMITPLSLVELNPVYKEMLAENPSKRTLGLLTYPVLQAADILLYQTDVVPVGKDQAPHIELARDITRRFNARFNANLKEPKTLLAEGEKIFSLSDPSMKMSKSHGEKHYIGLLDSPEDIKKKIASAVTDSEATIQFNPETRPGISNLIRIMQLITGFEIAAIERRYAGKGYREFKEEFSGTVIKFLAPGQKKYAELMKSKTVMRRILADGDKRTHATAKQTAAIMREHMGLLPPFTKR
jgi:tryptophanyl-tRNA synthetase